MRTTKEIDMIATDQETHAYVPGGTRVLNIRDGEPGHVMNGFSHDPAAGWIEYEVETAYGVERWQRCDFVLFAELET